MSAVPFDGSRWRFVMAALDDPTGPEARALDRLGQGEFDETRPASVQMNDLCDRAREAVAKETKW